MQVQGFIQVQGHALKFKVMHKFKVRLKVEFKVEFGSSLKSASRKVLKKLDILLSKLCSTG